ncbi:MAG TPA: hypothetical protein ENL35_00810 [Chloroflexi bacterium]|nr:hypothetical protein [Chloroflexota bacterium]
MEDLEKLRILVPHWIEHNAEHAAEFRAWGRRAGGTARALIETAADQLEAANRSLEEALKALGGPIEGRSSETA